MKRCHSALYATDHKSSAQYWLLLDALARRQLSIGSMSWLDASMLPLDFKPRRLDATDHCHRLDAHGSGHFLGRALYS